MKKMLTLTTAALIGLSVAGTAPALAHSGHGFEFHGYGVKVGIGSKHRHRVKVCYFNPYFDEFVCKWRSRRVWY